MGVCRHELGGGGHPPNPPDNSNSVRKSVRKQFSDLNEICTLEVDECYTTRRYGQGHEGPKVAKMTDFKVCLFRKYASNQKTNDEL